MTRPRDLQNARESVLEDLATSGCAANFVGILQSYVRSTFWFFLGFNLSRAAPVQHCGEADRFTGCHERLSAERMQRRGRAAVNYSPLQSSSTTTVLHCPPAGKARADTSLRTQNCCVAYAPNLPALRNPAHEHPAALPLSVKHCLCSSQHEE